MTHNSTIPLGSRVKVIAPVRQGSPGIVEVLHAKEAWRAITRTSPCLGGTTAYVTEVLENALVIESYITYDPNLTGRRRSR